MTVWLANLMAYSVQLSVLVTAGVGAAAVLRLREPRTATRFWHALFLGAVVLPLAQPWLQTDAGGVVARLVVGASATGTHAGQPGSWWGTLAVALLIGASARVAWLGLGLLRLRRLRAGSRPLLNPVAMLSELQAHFGTRADVRLSDEVAGPVTFGIRRPTVLLPSRALRLPAGVLRAILCHELLHVRRRDWLWTIAEATWGAALWLHPTARVLVTRVSLAREIRVDQETIAYTRDRRAYAAALLTFSTSTARPLSAATPFFGRRHLSDRIAHVTREFPMHAGRSRTMLGIAIVVVTLTTGLAARQVPLAWTATQDQLSVRTSAMTQAPTPLRPGGDVVAPRVVHSEKPAYTAAALAAKIQGSVLLELVVRDTGTVGGVNIIESLDTVHGLDEAALDAASRWTFEPGTKDGAPVPVIVAIEMTFTLKE